MASSCQLKCFLSPPRGLKYSSSSCRQVKYSFSPFRELKYSSSSSSGLKYLFSPSRQFKYFSSPCCELKDSSSPSPQWEYHVFLSFRFETRHNFTTQLLQALKGKGLNVFFDEQKLENGKDFLPQLIGAIAVSKLSIIILSAEYAKSDICLTELSNIMDRKRNQQHMVLPIYYHVDRSDVQNIRGDFEKYFKDHESNEKIPHVEVQRWKAAFAEVGTLEEGIHIKDEDDIPETDHINHIVDYAIQKLRKKHQVLLSFGEDTRLKFTGHLLKALKGTGINVSSGQGEQLSQPSDLSIIVLSQDYVSSESCSAQLFDIMRRRRTRNHIVLPIFYHVKTSDLQKLGETQGKEHLAEVAQIQGFPIRRTSERHDYEHIEDVVQWVIQELNRKSRLVSDGLVGIDDHKETILRLIEQKDSRIIGLWGMGGMGKTTLAEAVYNEISSEIQSRCFVRNVREKIEKKGMESVRDELLSKLLNNKIHIDTPTIGNEFIRESMETKRVIVVLDDVSDPEHIELMGVKFFGDGSKIIITSRDRQVLKNVGADKIHKVKKLNENDSLQLFSKFAFKLMNPTPEFQDLSHKFLVYAQGIPLILKVLGSKLYTKSPQVWESELKKLEKYPEPKISQILKISFDDLDPLGKNIFLDIACFLKGGLKGQVEETLSCVYEGAVSTISNLVDKCLLEMDSNGRISMHDEIEKMGKDMVCQGPKDSRKLSRLWTHKDVNQVLKYNEVNESVEGMKFHHTLNTDPPLSCPHGFENMVNLKYMDLYFRGSSLLFENGKVLTDSVDSVSLPEELRYLGWYSYPFKCLSPSFNPKNLVVLKLSSYYIERLWNEDYQVVNLRAIDLYNCMKLREIPNLLGANKLQRLICFRCESLVELPRLHHLASLKSIHLGDCTNFSKIPNLPIKLQILCLFRCTRLVELPYLGHLTSLESLDLSKCTNLRKVPNLLGAINLKSLDCCWCTSLVEPPELPNNITKLDLSHTGIEEVADSIQHLTGLARLSLSHLRVENVSSNFSKLESLRVLILSHCERLKTLPELPRYLLFLDAEQCTSLEKVSFTDHNFNSFHSLHDGAPSRANVFMLFSNCRSLNQDSIKNIAANAMLQIHSLAQRWVMRKGMSGVEHKRDSLFCCFPENEVSSNVFCFGSMSHLLNWKITPNVFSGCRFLAFAICLVADLTFPDRDFHFICKYQLTAASGEKLSSACLVSKISRVINDYKGDNFLLDGFCGYKGDHAFILFNQDMIIIDNEYEEASFEFYIRNHAGDEFRVEKCGVNIFYVDAESYTITDVMRCDKSNQNFDSATGDERRFDNEGEEVDEGPKTLK